MRHVEKQIASGPCKPLGVSRLLAGLNRSLGPLKDSALALLPIVLVIAFFQLAVLRHPIPNMMELLSGVVMVLLGLTLFVREIGRAHV